MNRIKEATQRLICNVQSTVDCTFIKVQSSMRSAGDVLANDRGIAKSVETVGEIVAGIAVIAALTLGILKLFNVDLLPMISQKIKDIFSMT